MLNIHHIGFEVKCLEQSRQIFEKHLGFRTEQSMELNGEKILFLVNDPLRIELIENELLNEIDLSQAHICFEINDLQFLNGADVPVIEGPIMMDNGWTSVFIQANSGGIIEFLKRN